MILVTGATGNVGRHLIRELAAAGAPARALVRSAQAGGEASGLGVETAVGAFEARESLRRALDGVERLYLVSPPGAGSMADAQLRVVEAARESGVRHVVKQSSVAADEPTDASIVAAHRRVEEELERSGIAWTHLRPNWFMQNELGQAGGIASDGVFYAPDVTRVSMIDARDVASVAAHVLTREGHEGKGYTLTGPEALSYPDVAAVYSRVLGREVRWQEVDFDQARDSMLAGGLPDELATGFVEIMRRYREGGVTRAVSPVVRDLLGRDPRPFEQFVAEHRSSYGA